MSKENTNAEISTSVGNDAKLPVSRSFAFGECIKVLHCFHGHEFEIGEIVCIIGKSDYDDAWLCRNAKGIEWYLHDEEGDVVNCG